MLVDRLLIQKYILYNVSYSLVPPEASGAQQQGVQFDYDLCLLAQRFGCAWITDSPTESPSEQPIPYVFLQIFQKYGRSA